MQSNRLLVEQRDSEHKQKTWQRQTQTEQPPLSPHASCCPFPSAAPTHWHLPLQKRVGDAREASISGYHSRWAHGETSTAGKGRFNASNKCWDMLISRSACFEQPQAVCATRSHTGHRNLPVPKWASVDTQSTYNIHALLNLRSWQWRFWILELTQFLSDPLGSRMLGFLTCLSSSEDKGFFIYLLKGLLLSWVNSLFVLTVLTYASRSSL